MFNDNCIVIDSDVITNNCGANEFNIQGETITFGKNTTCNVQIVFKNCEKSFEIVLEEGANVSLAEQYLGKNKFKKTLKLQNNSKLEKITIVESEKNEVLETAFVYNDASLDAAFAHVSNGNVKDTIICNLDGQGSSANVITSGIARDKQDKNITIKVINNAKNSNGNLESFGVSREEGNLVFNGFGQITYGNSGSSATQTQKIILFDEKSKGETNPFLLIGENDVVASHAAGIGQVNQEHLYYLKTRGISEEEARKMIALGYLMPVAEKISSEELREQFILKIKEKVA